MRRIFLFSSFFFAACGSSFAPVSLVTGLRLLAVRADPPELRPGESTELTALVVDPKGGGREVSILWARCAPPGVLIDLLACQRSEYLTPLGSGPRLVVQAPADYLTTDPRGTVEERILFIVLWVQAGNESIAAFKQVKVTSQDRPLNQNPRLGEVRATLPESEAALERTTPGATVRLLAAWDPTSAEDYLDDGAPKKEEMRLAWFATAGSLDRNTTVDDPQNLWVAPFDRQTVQFWLVLRDGRNGTDWTSFTLEVR
jgi:hypothetical protein